jgi:hypothetical protein
VANALNRHGIGTSSRNKVSTVWGADEVWERVKHYENRLKRDPHAAVESLKLVRETLVDQWIVFAKNQTGA